MPYVGKNPTIGNFLKLDTITTSATATYNLLNGGVAYSPQSPNHCIVSLNGVIQSPTTSFTISGSTIVFASALTSNDVIDFILVLGDVLNIGTPSDATVGFSKVTSNLITGATAETSIAGDDSILIYDDSATALRKMTRTNFVGGGNTPIIYAQPTNATTLANNTFTKITLDDEIIDTNGVFASSRFTATTAGKYLIIGNLSVNLTVATAYLSASIYKNGVAINYGFGKSNLGSANTVNAVTSIITSLSVNDYIELYGIHDNGTSRDTNAGIYTGLLITKLIE
jgi:hypothetical protein